MNDQSQQRRLLARHFFRRFLDNDLIAPDSEMQANLGLIVAVLAVPSLLSTVPLIFRYSNPWVPPFERMLLALDDKFEMIAISMIVTAIATLVEWDALWLDSRDRLILGPLPIAPRTMLTAKVQALGLFALAMAVIVNAIPTVSFPVIWLITVPVGFLRALWFIGAHALASFAAAATAFLAVVAVRGLLVNVLAPRWFAVASAVVQFVAVLGLVTAFLLLPAWSSGVSKRLARPSAAVAWSPPMWFLGIYETVGAGAIIDDSAIASGARLLRWQVEENTDSGREYTRAVPMLRRLALRGVLALLVSGITAVILYVLSHLRRAKRLGGGGLSLRGAAWKGRAWGLLGAASARDPVGRGTFVFTLQTLARSGVHRLYVTGFIAGGCALIVATMASEAARKGWGLVATPSSGLLAIQFVLVFTIVMGVRFVVGIPVELRANWLFRVTDLADARRLVTGARRALRLVPATFLVGVVPLHAALWGWRVTGVHFATGLLLALILVEATLIGFRKVPCTSAYIPGRANLKATWSIYLLVFLLCTYGLARIELITLAGGWLWLAGGLVALLAALMALRARALRRDNTPIFMEEPDPAVQTLGLMGT